MSSVTLLSLVLSAVLYETVSACTVCTSVSGTGTCAKYTSYITCLKGMISDTGCTSLHLAEVDTALAAAETAMKRLCPNSSVAGNGTTSATTSMLMLLTLPLLTYILSRN
ncbi:uncharacterized protein LOC129923799 [Biomphalaria glabrata]|uniref:Uncharacterized protein LOC129923799 n=1 Tax=Biomphalaria glabrata TaxID=6526 RepID=A0A9W2ZC86_BIOGL|nr:uncharacterized protein LOC129923799 [Biomphalaria glabrata]XP_055872511.1 uncharacterized protein LOC129923799 [Biomphalaria glabrata]